PRRCRCGYAAVRSVARWRRRDRRYRSRCHRSVRAGGWAKSCSTPTSCGRTIDDCSCGAWLRLSESRRLRALGEARSWPQRSPCWERGSGSGRGNGAAVLATLSGEPWLVRDGNVLLLGSRLDTAWTALPATPAFVPFVDALVNRLVRGEAPVSEVEGDPRVEFRTRGADTIGATVYALDPRESDLTPAPPALVRDVLGAEVLDATAFAAARFAGAGRHDASGLLLVLALVFALVELGVATRTR